MGVYLSQPITDKVSSDLEKAWLKCGVSSMQGWRSSQEDAHNCVLDYDKETSFFAVYDGHGGHEVAEYTARHLPDFLKTIEAYKGGDFEKALVDAFIDFDATLTEESVIAKLKEIAMENSDDQGHDKDEDEVDVAELKEEAKMPLTELIAKYACGGGKNPALRRVSGDSTSQPASPYLKAKPDKQEGPGCSKDGGDDSVNGFPETNGEAAGEDKDSNSAESKIATGGSGSSTDKDAKEEAAGSALNGEHTEEKSGDGVKKKEEKDEEGGSPDDEEKKRIKSAIRKAKKKATVTMLAQLFEENPSDSDSDNDESFHAKDTVNEEDDEEDEEVEADEEDDDEAEEEGEEEEESDEEDSTQFCDEESAGSESGCAAVVALLHKSKLFVANAGDSRAVLCRQGKAVDLSIDHKPDDPLEGQRIKKAGGRVTYDGRVNGGLNLSRALGDHYYKKCPDVDAKSQMITALPDIQIAEIDLTKDEFLVLACDGIWNSMSSQEVVDFVKPLIKEGQKLSVICEKLFDKCLAPDTMGDGTGCDNMTCIIVQFSAEGAPASSPESCKRSASPLPDEDSNKRPK